MARARTSRKTKPAGPAGASRGRRLAPWLGLAGVLVGAWLAWEWFTLPDVAPLGRQTPGQSALMRLRVKEAAEAGKPLALRHEFVPLARISPLLQRAVVLGEDQKFWMHDGIDWAETRKAVAEAADQGKLGRGASTITQQLAKNLFLSEDRSLARKAKEWILAGRLEDALEKKRILELYLNFAEWGEGVFGVEAAARHHFGKSAAQLDAGEAAVLTAMLPSPRKRDPKTPSKNLALRAYRIADLLAQVGLVKKDAVYARVAQLVGADQRRRKGATAAR